MKQYKHWGMSPPMSASFSMLGVLKRSLSSCAWSSFRAVPPTVIIGYEENDIDFLLSFASTDKSEGIIKGLVKLLCILGSWLKTYLALGSLAGLRIYILYAWKCC